MTARPRAVLAMRRNVLPYLLDDEALSRLRKAVDIDADLVLEDFTGPDARRALPEADVLISGWGCPPVDEAALALASRLRAIVHAAGSVRDHVTEACWDRGILVSSAAAANAIPVAEYTLAMILLANKKVFDMARAYRARRERVNWNERYPDAGNYRRTVGILSASKIGIRVMDLLRPFDLEVLVHDPYLPDEGAAAHGARKVPLRELFQASDVVSVHTPLLPRTRNLVSAELLSSMRTGSTLINTARGAVVDQEALTAELRSGRINAVLDVTEPEPLTPDSPLFDLDNVVLTPHVAGSKGGEIRRLMAAAVDEVENFALGLGFAHPVYREALPRLA